jgi:hypothetical protein
VQVEVLLFEHLIEMQRDVYVFGHLHPPPRRGTGKESSRSATSATDRLVSLKGTGKERGEARPLSRT